MSRAQNIYEHGCAAMGILSAAYPVIVEGQAGIAISDTDFDAIVAHLDRVAPITVPAGRENTLKLNGKTFFRSSHVYRHG